MSSFPSHVRLWPIEQRVGLRLLISHNAMLICVDKPKRRKSNKPLRMRCGPFSSVKKPQFLATFCEAQSENHWKVSHFTAFVVLFDWCKQRIGKAHLKLPTRCGKKFKLHHMPTVPCEFLLPPAGGTRIRCCSRSTGNKRNSSFSAHYTVDLPLICRENVFA